jgi:hypothetical protein
MPRSSSRRGSAADESQITPELVAEIADLVYLRLQQELRHERERARRGQRQIPRRRGGK